MFVDAKKTPQRDSNPKAPQVCRQMSLILTLSQNGYGEQVLHSISAIVSQNLVRSSTVLDLLDPPLVLGLLDPPLDPDLLDPPLVLDLLDPPLVLDLLDPPLVLGLLDPPLDPDLLDHPLIFDLLDPPLVLDLLDPPLVPDLLDPPLDPDLLDAGFSPFRLHEISVLIEPTLGHLRYCLTDVPPQPNSLNQRS